MIYSSAPTFPHGVVDDIKSLSIVKEYDVDCILIIVGRDIVAIYKKFDLLSHDGYAIDAANGFENLGVTSISIDLHSMDLPARCKRSNLS